MKKKCLILFGLLTVIAACIYVPYIWTDTPFIIGVDAKMQYLQFYEELKTVLHSGNLPFYDFTLFLGNDLYSSRLFLNYDIFDYLCALFNFSYTNATIVSSYLRILIGGFSFFALISMFSKHTKITILSSVCFVFSGWAMFNFKDQFLFSFYCFLPLYFIAFERYLKKGKWLMYIFMVAYFAIDNYYLFYTIAAFSPIYYFYRYCCINGGLQGWFKKALKLCGYFFIGVLISAFALVPNILHIMQNTRVGNSENLLYFDSIKPYMQVVNSLFNYGGIIGNRGGDFNSSLIHNSGMDKTIIYLVLWCGSYFSILFFQCFRKESRYALANKLLTIFFIISFCVSGISSAFHGFSAANFRWSFLASFMLIIMVVQNMEECSFKINKKLLMIPLLLSILMLAIYNPVVLNFMGIIMSLKEFSFSLIQSGIVGIMCGLIYFGKNSWLMLVIIIEVGVTTYFSVFDNPSFKPMDIETYNKYRTILGNKDEVNKLVLSVDEANNSQFYRYFLSFESVARSVSLNTNLIYNIKGTSTYDSTYSFALDDLDKILNIRWDLAWMLQIQDLYLLDFVNVKYALVADKAQLPHKNYKHIMDTNYLGLFENMNYFNMGIVNDQLITYEQVVSSQDVLNYIICEASDYEAIEKYITKGYKKLGFDYVYEQVNGVYIETTLEEKSFAVLSIPYNKGFTITANGIELEYYAVNGGFIGIPLEAGYSEIVLTFVPNGLKIGGVLSALGLLLIPVIGLIDRKQRQTIS